MLNAKPASLYKKEEVLVREVRAINGSQTEQQLNFTYKRTTCTWREEPLLRRRPVSVGGVSTATNGVDRGATVVLDEFVANVGREEQRAAHHRH